MELPESEYVAGSKIKAISVGVYDRQKQAKLCEKKILGTYSSINFLSSFFSPFLFFLLFFCYLLLILLQMTREWQFA